MNGDVLEMQEIGFGPRTPNMWVDALNALLSDVE